MMANIAGASTLPTLSALLLRSIIADIQGQNTSPDITAELSKAIQLSAAINGISITPDTAATIERGLSASDFNYRRAWRDY